MEKFKKFSTPAQLLYFAENGESMSDAQNMKGKCTQVAEDVLSHVDSVGPVKETITFDGKSVSLKAPKNLTASEIGSLVGKDAEANALNGWYARAIEAKNHIMENIRNSPFVKFLEGEEKVKSESYDVKFEMDRPMMNTYTEDDILGEWSANEMADFLIKEQYCATVGKLIHKNGKLHQIYNTPLTSTARFQELADGAGRKAYPVEVTPVYEGEALTEIKNMYLAKHDEHREVEKKVNWYKAKLHNELSAKNAEAHKMYAEELDKYETARAEYQEKYDAFLRTVRNENNSLRAICEARREKLLNEASALKIFIPEVLRPIKKFVQEYKAN